MKSNHECTKNLAIIKDGIVVSGCELCLNSKQSQGNAAAYERNWQRREHRRDIIQPNEPREYVKVYGAAKAREAGYSDAMIRKYG